MLQENEIREMFKYRNFNRYVVAITVPVALLLPGVILASENISQAQSDVIDTNLDRPTTTRVVPSTQLAISNENGLARFEVSPNMSEISSSSRNLDSPSVFNPSYTITNVTITHQADVLKSEYPNSNNPYSNLLKTIIVNSSQAVINGTLYE